MAQPGLPGRAVRLVLGGRFSWAQEERGRVVPEVKLHVEAEHQELVLPVLDSRKLSLDYASRKPTGAAAGGIIKKGKGICNLKAFDECA